MSADPTQFKIIQDCLRAGNYSAALIRTLRLLEHDPQNLPYLAVAATSCFSLGRYIEAKNHAELAFTAAPEERFLSVEQLEALSVCRITQGLVKVAHGERPQGMALLTHEASYDPGSYTPIIEGLDQLGKYDEIERLLKTYLKRSPDSSWGHYMMAKTQHVLSHTGVPGHSAWGTEFEYEMALQYSPSGSAPIAGFLRQDYMRANLGNPHTGIVRDFAREKLNEMALEAPGHP